MGLDWATEVLPWDELRKLIELGTPESLGKLRRSEQVLKAYRSAMDKVRQEYVSVADFIKISVLERACRMNADGKKEAVDSEQTASQQLVWHLNDFPYYFEDNMQHWVLWCDRQLDMPVIWQHIEAKFPSAEYDSLMFVNPPSLQSITALWHCHVLVRPRQQEAN